MSLPQIVSLRLPVLLVSIVVLQVLYWRYANQFPVCITPPQTALSELLFRAIFSGTVIASALILSRYFGPFWGAVVGGTYPASFGSQLMIFQSKYHARYLPSLIKTVPVGVLSTTVYSSIVVFCYDSIGIFMGTVVALTASLLTSSIVAIALRGVKDNNMLDQTSGPTNSVLV